MKVNLYGEIVSDKWDWMYSLFEIPHCCPRQVREAIAALKADEDLILEINSPGGDVWSGFEIFGLLQECRAHTEAHIIAMAASAATTVSSACDTVLASPVAQLMVHQPQAIAGCVNNDGARELLQFLDSVRASIVNGYVIKAAGKTSRARFEELVDDSTWMPVQDAMELGLVDGILDADEETAQRIREQGGILVTNMASLSPAPAALLERYEAAVRAGTMEEVPGHPVAGAHAEGPSVPSPEALRTDWRLQAAVDLERVRDV